MAAVKRAARAEALFDILATGEGWTVDLLAEELGCRVPLVRQAIHDLRRALADADLGNIVAEPDADNKRGQWRYWLVESLTDSGPWVGNRLADAQTRTTTITSVLRPIVATTPGNTSEGRAARKALRYVEVLQGELDDLVEFWAAVPAPS